MGDRVNMRSSRGRREAAVAIPHKRAARVDPIQAEVVARFLLATAEEMGATLMRTAFSPNIKERADCSTAIFDAAGQVVALAQRVPIHLGSMVGAVDAIRARFAPEQITPGDMFAANDPYNGGGSHLPDINVIAPVFIDPLFNTYTELKAPALRESILSLARATGFPADHVYVEADGPVPRPGGPGGGGVGPPPHPRHRPAPPGRPGGRPRAPAASPGARSRRRPGAACSSGFPARLSYRAPAGAARAG